MDDEELDELVRKANEASATEVMEVSIRPAEASQPPIRQEVESVENMVIDNSNGAEGNMLQAVERIKFLES